MGDTPQKYHEGNTLIHEPSGRIHFVNKKKKEYYWTAKTNQVSFTHKKDNDLKDYFGFLENSNELFYFTESGYQRINCDELEQVLASINEGRTDGVKFEFSTLDSDFWIDFHDGTVYLHEKEVETQKFDMIQIQRRDYCIWDAANKKNRKMDLKFSKFIKCLGPCICKPYDAPHGEDDYTQQNFQLHENLRNRNMFVLQFRDYFDLLEYEKSKQFPRLPKDPLIVNFDKPVRRHDMAYYGLYQGHIQVIAKEITGEHLATKDSLSENLHKFNRDKHFLTFYGIHEFKNRSFLIFESFSHLAVDSTRETLFVEPEELFKNLKGLIQGVAYMHNEMRFPANVNMYGNVGTSNVVVVNNGGNGQRELKLFVEGFCDDESKTKTDDLRGLAQVLDRCITMVGCANEESMHLIQCLRVGRCDISMLIEHPTFWTPETKLDFIAACHGAWHDIPSFEKALHTIEPALKKGKKGNIDTLFFRRMEAYGSYSIGKPSSTGQLTRFIRNATSHERELSKEDVGRFYNCSIKGLEEYFRVRFTNLLIELYKLVKQTCATHKIFEKFDIPSV